MNNNITIKILGIAFFCLSFCVANGQEEQVAFLPGVFELTEAQRAKADVLTEQADGFFKAQLFKRADDYMMRIEFQKRARQWVEEINISSNELELLREKLRESISSSSSSVSDGKNASGRAYLITSVSLHAIPQSAILSNLFYKEITVTSPFFPPYTYEEKTRLGRAFPYLVTAGAITSSILLTRDKQILPSAANMHFWGSLFGYGHGFLLSSLILDNQESNLQRVMISGTSILEGWLGYQIAKKHKFSYTRSKAINSGNLWGGFSGIMAYGMFANDYEFNRSTFGFSGLLGSGLGLFAANRLVQKYPRSSGDITAINMAGLVGLSWGTYAAISFDMEGRGAFYSLFIGSLGGLALSGLSTKNTNFTNLEGGLVAVSSIAGGAMGLGIANLVDAGDNGYTISAALGLTAGWIITYQILAKNEIRLKSLGFGEKLRWSINPASIGMAMSSSERQASLMRQNIRMDMVGLSYSF